jgi:hypothetical protein
VCEQPGQPGEVIAALAAQAAAIAELANNQGAFDAALDAFTQADRNGFRYVLGQEGLLERCELICGWLRPKLCVLTCLALCGPPGSALQDQPPFGRVAEAIGRIASDESLLAQVVRAVWRRDADDFRSVVEQVGCQDVCQYVCSWFCSVLLRRACSIICSPVTIEMPSAAEITRAAATSVLRLAADRAHFDAAVAAVLARDCGSLRDVLAQAGIQGGCAVISEWLCTVQCTWMCLDLGRTAPLPAGHVDTRAEVLGFARAVAPLSGRSSALAGLAEAVRSGQASEFARLAGDLRLEAHCVQLCRWVCARLCQEFCGCVCPPRSTAVFTRIGGYFFDYDIASALGGNGLTSDNRAFYSTMRLNGGFAVASGAPQIEYRFETVTCDAIGNTTGTWTPVLPAQVAATSIGSFVRVAPPFASPIEVWVNGTAGPNVSLVSPDADGWIRVPPYSPSSGWQFIPGSDLINLISATLQPFPAADETGVEAGSSATTPLPADVYYGIRMRVREAGSGTDGDDAGTCAHVAIANTLYDSVSHHFSWDGYVGSGELAVYSVGLAELDNDGCAELWDSLTARFTAAHPNLDTSASGVTVTLIGPGGPYPFTLAPAAPPVPGNWYGQAIPEGWNVDSLEPCAYIIELSVNVLLTTGDAAPSPRYDQVAFSKSR